MDLNAGGFGSAEPRAVASEAEAVLDGWFRAATEHPPAGLEERWRALLMGDGAEPMEPQIAGEPGQVDLDTQEEFGPG